MLPRESPPSFRINTSGVYLPPAKSRSGTAEGRPVSAVFPLETLSQNQLRFTAPPLPAPRAGRNVWSAGPRSSLFTSSGSQRSETGGTAQGERVRVAVRCRPPNPSQGERADDVIVAMNPSASEVSMSDHEGPPWRVDTPLWSCPGCALDGSRPASQASVYAALGRPLLLHALDGYSSTLIAYGQTGSGKTYTMMGDHRDGEGAEGAGIIPRLCQDLFAELQNRSHNVSSNGERLSWEVHVRFIEVYCEKISDLLNSGASVNVREEVTPQSANFVLVGARRVRVMGTEDLLQALSIGNRWRRTAATKLNDRSSRSHAMFLIDLTEMISFDEPDGTFASAPSKNFSIRLVDLAGSERVSETGTQGQNLKEAKDINLSLFTLGLVIESLSDSKRRGIKPPYRDSVLTKLLRDAFGGNSKTTMVCTIGPCESQRLQTVQTLHYACKARYVTNKPSVKEELSALELRRANEELTMLRRQLEEAQRNGSHYESIEAELREANKRLHAEQTDAKMRKQIMERREAELAGRLRDLEDQREAYEVQMQALEGEAEKARLQQEKREWELHRAHEAASKYAEERLKEMEEQRVASEVALRAKEEELRRQQHIIEARMKEAEESSRLRVEELQRQQHEMETMLKEKERLASLQEQDLRCTRQLAEEELIAMEKRNVEMAEEWAAKLRALEAAARQREEEITQRTREVQGALSEAEAAARQKEEEMQKKWREADAETRRLQTEMTHKEEELKQRVLEANRQAEHRENQLNELLREMQYKLGCRDRESAQQQQELEALRMVVERQSESTRVKERSIEEDHMLRTASLRAFEAQLRQREEDLRKGFDDVMAMKREWDQKHLDSQLKLQEQHDAALQEVKQRELALAQREMNLNAQNDELASKLRAREMQFEKQQVELISARNEFEMSMQQERRRMLRAREEMQLVQDRYNTDQKLRQGSLQAREKELLDRRVEQETTLREREAVLRNKEAELMSMQDATTAKELELYHAQEQLKAEQANANPRATPVGLGRGCLTARFLTHLHRFEMGLAGMDNDYVRSPGASDDLHMSMGVDSNGNAPELTTDALDLQEQGYLAACEGVFRSSIAKEAKVDFGGLTRTYQLEARDIQRRAEVRAAQERADALQEKLSAVLGDSKAMESRAATLQTQVETLKQELEGVRSESLELKVQMNSAVSAAKFAETQIRQLRVEAYEADARHRDREHESQAAMIKAQAEAVDAARRNGDLLNWSKRLLLSCEREERCLLEHHQSSELESMQLLRISDRRVMDRDNAILKWQCLYHHCSVDSATRSRDDSARQQCTVEESHQLRELQHNAEMLMRKEECLAAEQERFEQRVVSFENYQRAQKEALSRQEQDVKKYIEEMETMDQRKMREYEERERNLVEIAEGLKRRRQQLGTSAQDMLQSFLQRSVEQESVLVEVHEELDRASRARADFMEQERNLIWQSKEGDAAAMEKLMTLHDECTEVDQKQVREQSDALKREEDNGKMRIAEQEKEIQRYLLEIEAEDVRRDALSQEGQAMMREAEERLAKAQLKEAAVRDLARQVRLKAMKFEAQTRKMESTMRKEEHEAERQRKHRQKELEQQQRVAASVAESNERTLLELESNLKSIMNKNKDAEQIIRNREAEIQRQKKYYIDLSKMLEERNEMLRKEHALRRRGTQNAGSLAKDLLDANDNLQKQLSLWKHKFDVLHSEDKVECEKCSWKNKKNTPVCMCCGFSGLLELSATAASLL